MDLQLALFFATVVTVPLVVGEIAWLIRARKHDRVLHPICEVRNDLMKHLVREWEAGRLEKNDYIYARQMLIALNSTVSLYREHRTRMFNLRALMRFLARYGASAKVIVTVQRTDNAHLRVIEQRLSSAMFRGFMAYTPFLTHEIVARIILAIMGLFALLGWKWMARRLGQMREFFAVLREQAQLLAQGPPQLRVA